MSSEPAPDVAVPSAPSYWLTRFLFLRLLGLVYTVAFLVLLNQALPLIGSDGLLPARDFLGRVASAYGPGLPAFFRAPTLFWLGCSDTALRLGSWVGLALSLVVLLGAADVPILASLWILYMSFVHVGQIFYGYGWEILLLEAGFLAIFLVPVGRLRPFPSATPPPTVVIVLLRWLAFRLMLGAGLIKLRGDPCWRDLSCLVYHYETQPIPNPLSLWLHQLPPWFHRLEVLFNHVVELLAPFLVFGPRRARHVAGVVLVLFQALLILSGNLSFLNWLTIAVCVSCFDDSLLGRLLPTAARERLAAHVAGARQSGARQLAAWTLACVVGFLSINPVFNMLSPGQVMNTSLDPFELVNTYGAFGSILRERNEIVLQGTDDPPGDDARWTDYEFKCKPGKLERRPCMVSPYHYRIDWQMWFAAMGDARREPWLVHLVYKLLKGDQATLGLLADGPFHHRPPPRAIRAQLYRYEFTRPASGTKAWWQRTLVGEALPALSVDEPGLLEYIDRHGWSR